MFTLKSLIHSAALFLFGLVAVTGVTLRAANSPVAIGQGVILSVSVDGTAPFSYQWYKDGVSLTGATTATFQIASFQAGDAGSYSAVISNSLGSTTSDSGTLTIAASATAPVFTTQPVSQTVTAGASVTFNVAASGNPVPTYQWRKDGTNIGGATGASYTIASTVASDAGTYTVVATNSAGSATSSGATLTVNPVNTAPTITAIAAQTTSFGAAIGPISFIVGDAQTAAGSLTVTGTSSNTSLVPAGNIIFGGSGANRTVTLTPATGQSGSTTVTVTVSDGTLTASTAFVLTVNAFAPATQTVSNSAAMTIPDSGPASVYPSTIAISGLGGTISAVSLSLNNFSHTWASDVDMILVSPTGQKIMLMSKAGGGGGATTNATLTFSNTATALLPQSSALVTGTYLPTTYGASTIVFPVPAPAAPYDTTFANLIGQPANGVWSLYVVDGWNGDAGTIAGGWTLSVTTTGAAPVAPTISDITNQSTTTGTATAAIPFTVGDADTALGSLTLSGVSSNTTLVPNGNITFGGSGANRTVTVSPVAGPTGTATISVTVSDGALTATDTFLLTVSAPLTAPVFTTQPTSLAVTAGSAATFTAVTNGNPAPTYQWQKNGVAIAGATAASCTLASVTASDASTYTVVATNSVGSTTSAGAVLTVNSAPIITTQPVSQTVTAGNTVTFAASASGLPTPTYQWRKNGSAIAGATSASFAIASTVAGDAATYSVVATNSVGSATSNGAVLTVNVVPVITTQPVSQAVTAGASVTLNVTASGTPAPAYQWRKDGTTISGATSPSYALSSAVSGDAGTYTVVATNAAGSATSTGAVLTVNPVNTAPTITAIAAQTTSFGAAIGPISFIVGDAQTAAGSLTVTGTSSNTTLVPVGNIVFGGSGANRTVTLTPVTGQSGTTTINVTVSDGTLTASTAFVLTVNALAPTTQTVSNSAAMTIPIVGPASVYPSDITISGLGGTISAVSLSLNNFSHTWASDVDVILVSPTGQKIMLMSKAGGGGGATTNATLTFSNTATALLPQSSALVTGTYLPTTYGASTIVFPVPAPSAPYDTAFANLIGQPANGVWSLYVVDGWNGDAGAIAGGWTLTVTTTGAAPIAPTISDITNQSTTTGTATAAIPFTVGDADTALGSLTLSSASSNPTLVPNGNITFGGSGANRTVTVSPVAGQTGTATISVTVSDGALTATDTFLLTVSAPLTAPVFTTQPASLVVTAGSSATFTAVATGNPTPTYQWQKNGSAISGATAASCTIANVSATDANNYSVVATNSVGSATSAVAGLTVNTVPVITTQPVSQTVTAGASVTFSAAATGNPAPTYQWRKNGTAIAGATGASYAITSTATGDAATYSVAATNSVGSATSTGATLTVNPATSAPVITTQPATQTVTKASAVTFKVVASGLPAPTYQWKKNGSKISGATGPSYTIASVSSGNAATYTVVVTNSLGSVTSSGAVLTVKTTTAPAVYRVDFNGDGKSDLLWQNSTTGECSVWLMSSTTVGSKVSLGNGPAGLKICGTGDFNNDGKTDILWQNGVTGACSVWLMNGTTVTSTVSLGTVSTDWQLCGAGDFNGDGKSDLVWQNRVTDECTIWLMSGTTVSSVVSLGQAPADLVLTGTGDFNKDGQSDILWQNEVTGAYGVWLMSGTTVGNSITIGTATLDWQMSGAGDYNADLQSDLLWQNLLTGETSVWLMNGTAVSSKVSLGIQPLDLFLRN